MTKVSSFTKALFPYALESEGFMVRVSVNYMAENSLPDRQRWFWSYHIRIENVGEEAAQLVSRHWEIRDARGALSVVDGPGIVGEQPIIKPGSAYDYVSGCPLSTPGGEMIGRYQMIDAHGRQFEIQIPRFQLQAPVGRG